MLTIKQMVVTCDFCGAEDNLRLEWDSFKLPKDWRYRTRSWRVDDDPDDIQIQCKECASK
jgi:hypothetical protein